MRIGIFPSASECATYAAQMLADLVASTPTAVLGVATGSTPEPTYALLRAAHAAGELSFAECEAFALDEYVGIDADHPERYRNVLLRHLVTDDATGLRAENLHTPDGNAEDPHAAALAYDRAIAERGGVDLQILGIGADGHIGFNEPGGALVSRTHVDVLTHQTRLDNARFFDGDITKVPTHCVTQGLATIMSAKKILLIATGDAKRAAVKELCEGGVSAFWPATILQMHEDVTVLVDEAAAADLALADFYRERWEN